MNSNEEYLDSLLKSIEQREGELEDSGLEAVEPPEIELSEIEPPEIELPEIEQPEAEQPELEIPEFEQPELEIPEFEQPELEIPEFEQPELEMPEFEQPEPEIQEPELQEPEWEETAADMDLDDLLKSMSDNEDLAEIQTLFEKADDNEPVSEEVEELLKTESDLKEGVSEDSTDAPKEKHKFFKKKGLKGLFAKKDKKKKDMSDSEAVVSDEEHADSGETDRTEWSDADIPDQGGTSIPDQGETNVTDQVETDNADQNEMSLAEQDENDLADISDLLASLNNMEESDFVSEETPSSTPELPEAEPGQVEDLLGELQGFSENDEQLDDIPKQNDENNKKEKKQGILARFLQFLTEEDEEEEKTSGDALGELSEGVEALKVTSDENQEALAQLKQEDQKGKKKKKKKGKKADQEKDAADEGNLDEDEGTKEEKKKKSKKEKKRKEPKVVDDTPTPKLSKKKVRTTFLFAFSIMAAILVCCLFVPELFEMQEARNAYYEGDYETCYRSLYGKKLSESDQIMFERAEFVLLLQRSMDSYESYLAIGDELRALDALLQKVASQEKLMETAQTNGLTAEAEASYQEILQLLSERYQLSEADALKICAYEQDALYTLHLKAIVAGEEFVCPDFLREDGAGVDAAQDEPEESAETPMEDVLPAEEELGETEFEEGIAEP